MKPAAGPRTGDGKPGGGAVLKGGSLARGEKPSLHCGAGEGGRAVADLGVEVRLLSRRWNVLLAEGPGASEPSTRAEQAWRSDTRPFLGPSFTWLSPTVPLCIYYTLHQCSPGQTELDINAPGP